MLICTDYVIMDGISCPGPATITFVSIKRTSIARATGHCTHIWILEFPHQ